MSEPGLPGLCPQCLLSLALKDSPAASPADEPGAGSDADGLVTLDRLAAGRILGERYQIRELLGRGGMGEVFRAFDLKLRVDVALKAVRAERVESEHAREQLRQEVRSAREVVSPNVCRIFDLIAEDGQELVSMEFIDGTTLGETLKRRGPLALEEAREIASQFLSGLEAIHQAGLVHRDFKPENVMLTRAGRVVVMDFGLAKARTEGPTGTISGTPAYMSPEQTRGDALDARADVFAAGVVLAEMLSVGGTAHVEARQVLWRGVRESPPRVPEGPWAGVLRQALSASPDERPGSARALSRALEEVTQRLPGFETKRPYPGLSSFTEEDAEYFFGRELEVEGLWKKLRRPRLLALVAPSGAGKSSFLRAGLLPALPKGWKALITTPGSRPFQSLARMLAPVFAGDGAAVEQLLRFEEGDTAVSLFQRFRSRHEQALVIVDQFEELFTLSPPQVQAAFSDLLGRLVLEADLHVVLALRDDFLYRCQEHAALVPAFSDLTPLPTLSESALRRALVQPALSCGYRFEDEALVDEMVAEVRKERGALPLLAFAASRLWETRDRDKGLITRAAYQEIGGVAGALAQHAEATLERIGTQSVPLVRELFRNLVTAQGTRAVRERDELLSVFGAAAVSGPGRDVSAGAAGDSVQTQLSGSRASRGVASHSEAERVLGALLDARLLTSYERPGEGGESHHQVEIVHESLLQAWPRLVRWQTQDADGAQLRDQLRQAAQLWQDRGKPEDLLWSGTAYRDFALWRERYAGGLTSAEEAFAAAATRRAGRRRRLRRAAAAAVIGAAVAVATVTSLLWRRAALEAEAREAAQILALGRLRLEDHPAAAVAYALASLERRDSESARRFAVEALWRGPNELVFGTEGACLNVSFSHDGALLGYGSHQSARVVPRSGDPSRVVAPDEPLPLVSFGGVGTDAPRLLVRSRQGGPVRLFSVPDGAQVGSLPLAAPGSWLVRGDSVVSFERTSSPAQTRQPQGLTVRSWPLSGAEPRTLGAWDDRGVTDFAVGADGSWLAETRDGALSLRRLETLGATTARPVGRGERTVWANPSRSALATIDEAGKEIRLWSVVEAVPRLERVLRGVAGETLERLRLDPSGRFIAAHAKGERLLLRLFDLEAPPDADPLALRDRDAEGWLMGMDFDPEGRWLAVVHDKYGTLWSLQGAKRPRVLRGLAPPYFTAVSFSPDGQSLVSGSFGGEVWLWPLQGGPSHRSRLFHETNRWLGVSAPQFDPRGRFVVVGEVNRGRLLFLPLDGGLPRVRQIDGAPLGLAGLRDGTLLGWTLRSKQTGGGTTVYLWDIEGGSERRIEIPHERKDCLDRTSIGAVAFLPDGRLLLDGANGVVVLDPDNGAKTHLRQCNPRFIDGNDVTSLAGAPDGHTILIGYGSFDTGRSSELIVLDLRTRAERTIVSHGSQIVVATLSPGGELLVTGSHDGVVRVGTLAGEEPHLLFGHTALVTSVAVSPDGEWIASAAEDGTIRLWPTPRGRPFQTLPYDELVAKLRALTNLRVVADSGSTTGYRVEAGPFPGWANVPEW